MSGPGLEVEECGDLWSSCDLLEMTILSFRYRAQGCRAAIWFHSRRMLAQQLASDLAWVSGFSAWNAPSFNFGLLALFPSNLRFIVPFIKRYQDLTIVQFFEFIKINPHLENPEKKVTVSHFTEE